MLTINRSSLREQARQALHVSIITGQIPPNELHTVGDFAKRLGVSATPVREALVDLANDGFVQIIRNRGFIVPEITEADLDEIFQLRMVLEVHAAERVAGHLSEEDVRFCQAEVDSGSRAVAVGDLTAFLTADRQFHLRLLEVLGNGRLLQIVDRLRDHARLYGLSELAASGALVQSIEEHQALLDAVRVGDSPEAGRQMMRHLTHTRGAWAGKAEAQAWASSDPAPS